MNVTATDRDRFFAVALSDWIGITDKLWQLSKLHDLGTALSYEYVHTPFSCVRSASSSYLSMAFLRCSKKLSTLGITSKYKSDHVGRFLGLERRQLNIDDPRLKNYRKTEVCLDEIFQNREFKSLDELKKIIDSIDRTEATVKVFTTKQGIYLYAEQIDQLLKEDRQRKNHFKGLEIAKHYWHARCENPIRSEFLPGKVKILVHIRTGDMASFRINSKVLSVFARSVCLVESGKVLQSSRDLTEIQTFTQPIALQTYLDLLEAIFQIDAPDQFSIVVISDGYRRAFEVILRALLRREIVLNLFEIFTLIKEIYRSEQRLKRLSSMSNTSAIIGESRQNLFKSIHAIAEADIVVKSSGSFASLIHEFLKKDERSTALLNIHSYSKQDLTAIGNLIQLRRREVS